MKKADQMSGFFLLIFSVIIMRESWQWQVARGEFDPGVGFLPFWVGAFIAFLSVLLIIDAWRRPSHEKKSIFPGRNGLMIVSAVLVSLAAYIALLEVLGFFLDTAVFIAFLLAVVEREQWRSTILVPIVTTGGLYFIFQMLLNVSLPKNIFGF